MLHCISPFHSAGITEMAILVVVDRQSTKIVVITVLEDKEWRDTGVKVELERGTFLSIEAGKTRPN